jgi:hypothetical protein
MAPGKQMLLLTASLPLDQQVWLDGYISHWALKPTVYRRKLPIVTPVRMSALGEEASAK